MRRLFLVPFLFAIVIGPAALVLSCASKPSAPTEAPVSWSGAEDNVDPQIPMRPPFRGCDGGLLADGEALPAEKPELVHKAPLFYSKEAAAIGVRGVALVRCIIELDGSLSECSIIKGLPFMHDEILASLEAWKYTPVVYCGHPQRVEMVIPVRLSPLPAVRPPQH
jgi:hypothetical protein